MIETLETTAPRLVLRAGRPPALSAAAREIDAHWETAQRDNPSLFDGTILMLRTWAVTDGRFEATCFAARFREYLFWRASGRPDWGFRHLFGVAAVQLHGGALLVVRAAPHTINSGRFHLPGGFVDRSDAGDGPDAVVNIQGQILREVEEELGLGPTEVVADGRWLVVDDNAEIGMVMRMRPAMEDDAFRSRVLTGLHGGDSGAQRAVDADENTEVQFVGSFDDISTSAWVPYCARVARAVLGAAR